MKEPKVTFKKVQYFRSMEGYGVNADVYINGQLCLFAHDDGNGGMMDFQSYEHEVKSNKEKEKIKNLIKELENYIDSLPDVEIGDLKFKPDMEWYIDELLDNLQQEKEKAKHKTKMKKFFVDSIVFGIPDDSKYYRIKYKKSLKEISTIILQSEVNEIKRKHLKEGMTIFNTNLEELGIKM